jgi:hypothetical protein
MTVYACLRRWRDGPVVQSCAHILAQIFGHRASKDQMLPGVKPEALVGALLPIAETAADRGAASAAVAALCVLARCLCGQALTEKREEVAIDAVSAALGALAAALDSPQGMEPRELWRSTGVLLPLVRDVFHIQAVAIAKPRLAAALASALSRGSARVVAAPRGGSGAVEGNAGAAAAAMLNCVSLITAMMSVVAYSCAHRVAEEVAGVPGALLALVRLLNHDQPGARRDAAKVLSLIIIQHRDDAALSALRRTPVAASLVALLRRDAGGSREDCEAQNLACALASLLAVPAASDQAEPQLPDDSISFQLAALMAASPRAMATVARQLSEIAAQQKFERMKHIACLIYNVLRAASSSPDDPTALRHITSGAPSLMPAVAGALEQALECTVCPALNRCSKRSAETDMTQALRLLICKAEDCRGAAAAVRAAQPRLAAALALSHTHACAQQASSTAGVAESAAPEDVFVCATHNLLQLLQEPPQPRAPNQSQESTPSLSMGPFGTPGHATSESAAIAASAASATPAQPPHCCGACGKTAADGARLRLCGGCRAARFCSDACYKAAWRAGHRRECKAAMAAAAQAAAGHMASAQATS